MSTKYPGGIIKSSPVVPSGAYQNSSASGVWTMEQAGYWIKQGNWPTAGNFNNRLYSWGNNLNGQLGLGASGAGTYKSSPTQVGALTTWLNIAGGQYYTLATKTDGTLWSWGFNTQGQLGLGNTTNYSSPKQVGALTTWLKIAVGQRHTIATKTDGTLWSWGQNNYGQLGLGTSGAGTYKSSPTQVGALTTWANIGCGNDFVLATKTDGTLWSWGYNGQGQLGNGNVSDRSSPVQVGGLTNWAAVPCNNYSALAIKIDGTLWAWGAGSNGVLGLGNMTDYSSPKQVGALTTWSNTSGGGGYFSLAIKTNGTLWAWGGNAYGNLGLGNTTDNSSPVQVGGLTNWSTIAGGSGFSKAIKTDGTLWSWGRNNNGQLGLGNTTYRSSPNQVGALTTWSKVNGRWNFSIAITS